MEAVGPSGFPPDAIGACLDRILGSPHFRRSRRLGRFLRFIVESTLEGRASDLKERTIGVEVYRRPLGYDPRADPIVRSEAHRLRARLAAYYAGEGSDDPIVIGVPRGSYVPELRSNPTEPEHGPEAYRLIVADFEDRSLGGPDAARAGALTEAVRAGLAGRGLRVETRSRKRTSDPLEGEYLVEGAFEQGHDQCGLTLRLLRLADEKEVWSGTERFAWKRHGRLGAAVAEKLATSIRAVLLRRGGPRRPTTARAYDLYVKGRYSVIQYGNTLDVRDLEAGDRRLRAALEIEPEFVDALAELAHLELMRLYPPRGSAAAALANARALLERALASEPGHARSLYLLGHVEGSTLRPREALRLTESAVALGPDDAEGRTMLAVRYASLGFWESAVVACEWAVALDPVWDAPRRIKAYLLTRIGDLDATRRAIDDLARAGSSPTELSMARFDLRIAENDFPGARAVLASEESTFALRPDLEDRLAIARALALALEGRQADARRTLNAHRSGGPRFWDHTIRLALVLGEGDLARDLFLANPIQRSYRWLANEVLVRPHLHRPRWRAVADDLHASWIRDLEEVGSRLPASPPPLPEPSELLRRPPPLPLGSTSGSLPAMRSLRLIGEG